MHLYLAGIGVLLVIFHLYVKPKTSILLLSGFSLIITSFIVVGIELRSLVDSIVIFSFIFLFIHFFITFLRKKRI